MGRKAKIIQKKDDKKQKEKDQRQDLKTQNNQELYQYKEESKKQDKKDEQSEKNMCQALTLKLQGKFNVLQELIKQVKKLKGQKSQQQFDEEFTKKRLNFQEKLQSISLIIIRQEVKSLQESIISQKQKIGDDITKIRKAYDESKASLQAASVFSEEQIACQLFNIEKKINNKQQTLDKLIQLENKSKTF